MTPKTQGWVVFIGAFGMLCALMSIEISELMNWGVMFTPKFVGTFIGHIGAVIAAFIGGKLIPENRDTTQRTRTSDK